MFKRKCIACGRDATLSVSSKGFICSESCRIRKNIEVRKQIIDTIFRIKLEHGLVVPSYPKTQNVAKAYEAAKMRDKMTKNWKEVADATGFNYDGTLKT